MSGVPARRRRPGGSLAGLLVAAALAGCGLLAADLDRPLRPEEVGLAHRDGEVLMARSNCLACHRADAATTARLASLPAPALGGIGWRASPGWLRRWLDEPHGLRPDTRMPDLLGGFDEEKQAEVTEKLTHFLMTLGGGFSAEPLREDDWRLEQGAELFDALGCRACHPDGVSGDLPAKTDLPTLAAFLEDPLRHRPSGAMPDMDLSPEEARSLAAFLLADQHAAGPADTVLRPGLEVAAYELDDFPGEMPDLDGLTPVALRSSDGLDVSARPRDEQYALRFSGELFVPEAGEQTLWLTSDDGSLLWIDGELVIDNDGQHAPVRAEGRVTLEAGWHALRVDFFEAGGGDEIAGGFVVDGRDRPFAAGDLRHAVTRWNPVGHTVDERPDPSLVWRGKIQFRVRRCISCHDVPGVSDWSSPDLDALDDLQAGCLAEQVEEGLPDYRFDDAERAALRRVLADRRVLREPLTAEQTVDHALARLDCLACHARDGRGGPGPALLAALPETADLGDEGRLPPDLTRVGARLRPGWIETVLHEGTKLRPSVTARMPRFGEAAVAPLVTALPAADGSFAAPPEPQATTEALEAGRTLVGRGGMQCITCHAVAGHEGTGLPGLDLATTPERLTWPGFHRWMQEPIAVRPGTRMPTYFEQGRSVVDHVLGGDAEAQIAALWSYLSMGDDLVLPEGLVIDRSGYDQVPVDRPLVVSVFMEGLSGRVLAVGHPERVHYAYDADHVRLARLWGGDFLNLEGTWRGRAGDLERPAGGPVIDLPPGPALAPADTVEWPGETGEAAGWQMAGQSRSDLGEPRFLSFHVGDRGVLEVTELVDPLLDAAGPRALRMLLLSGDGAADHELRAALAPSIEEQDDGSFLTSDGLRLEVVRGRARLVSGPDGVALRVAPELLEREVDAETLALPDKHGIAVEMSW